MLLTQKWEDLVCDVIMTILCVGGARMTSLQGAIYTSTITYDEKLLVPFVHISDTNDGCEHIAQTRIQSDLPANASIKLSSISGVTCMTSHTRPSHFSLSNIEKLEVAQR